MVTFLNKVPWHPIEQSGTNPILVANIWLPTLVTIGNGLPKLVANISSHIHHLVNTGLAVGMATNISSHTCKLDTIWVVCYSPIANGSILLYLALNNTLCPEEFYTQWC